MPLIATRGAASAQGFGEFAQSAGPVYIEDVFSTWLYTANGSTQTIINGIDMSGKGGMLWIKDRKTAGTYPVVVDTVRGANKWLYTSGTAAQATSTSSVTSFTSSGFTLGADNGAGDTNSVNFVYSSPESIASWAFRNQPKFFDVVTYTGNGQVSAQNIAHNLGSVPGMIIVKRTDNVANWAVYHRSMGATKFMRLNITNGEATSSDYWNNTEPTSTQFTVGIGGAVNDSGTYVAYLFAHNAGGFGLAGDQNVITCNSFTTDGSGNATVSLGYEPQWLLIKKSSSSDGGVSDRWHIYDTVRGIPTGAADRVLDPNNDFAEYTTNFLELTPTGFNVINSQLPVGETFIYVAIRRGPMETPTTGTEVFYPYVTTSTSNVGSSSGTMYNSQILSDSAWQKAKSSGDGWYLGSRMTATAYMKSETTAAESTSAAIVWDSNRGAWAFSDPNYGLYCFKRAPGFFDVVCYTGTGVARTVNHNLGVAPELMIVKSRNNASSWYVWGGNMPMTNTMFLEQDSPSADNAPYFNDTAPTASVFSVSSFANANTWTYVAYLFATVAGVSKVGSYTGTGTTQQINCGFTAGSRFVLIKRTDSTGDWYVWDSARGIVAGNDPYLLLNSTAAEVTNTDYVDTYSAGFEISSTAPAAINANGGTFIFLAIA